MNIGEIFVTFNLLALLPPSLLVTLNSVQRVRVTHAASRFAPSFLTLFIDTCGSHFLYPLLDVISSWPIGTINAEVPYFGVLCLSANNFHCSVSGLREMGYRPDKEVFLRLLGQKLCPEQIGDVF
jgi:hypothetical protein